jgi:hypothetical protein
MKLEIGTSYANNQGNIRKVNVIYTRQCISMVEYVDEKEVKGTCSHKKFIKWLTKTN